jgi:Zn-dependent protease
MQISTVQYIVMAIIPILFAITLHEVAHGWVASKFGDPTAKMLGRITLNPIKHIDLFGTIIVPVLLLTMGGFIFGWAKPVPVDSRNFKSPRQTMVYVAIAGPLANLLMAFMWAAIFKVSIVLQQMGYSSSLGLSVMSKIGIQINLVLFVLNLIPIPPLDGSKVLMGFVSGKMAYHLQRIEPYGFFIILALIYLGIFNIILYPVVSIFYGMISTFFGI